MSVAYLGTAVGNAWLQEHLTSKVVWLALCIAEPTPLFNPSTEVLGGGYIRKRVIFGSPSSKAVANTNNLLFTALPSCVVRWLAVMSDQFAGDMIAAIEQDSPETVPSFGQYLGAPGDIAVQL